MMIPTIHMNGTSKEALVEALSEAYRAVNEAGRKLAEAYPNGRDYYPQGAGAINTAMKEHESRMERLRSVAKELEEIVVAID